MAAKFPKPKVDGSICVEVTIPVRSDDDTDLGERIQQWWTDVWLPERGTWRVVFRTGQDLRRVDVEILEYTEEFSAAPHVVFCKDSKLRFRLEGRRSTKVWKDWVILRILPDLREQFSEIQNGVLSVCNCD